MAAVHSDAYCFTAFVPFFIFYRLVREKDVHEKFDKRYRREMATSFYADNIHDKRNFHSSIISRQSWNDNIDEQLTIGKYECHSPTNTTHTDSSAKASLGRSSRLLYNEQSIAEFH
jgi:hypothetical protein